MKQKLEMILDDLSKANMEIDSIYTQGVVDGFSKKSETYLFSGLVRAF